METLMLAENKMNSGFRKLQSTHFYQKNGISTEFLNIKETSRCNY